MLKLIEKTAYTLVAGFTIFGMGLNASAAKQETISTNHYFQVTNTQLQDIKKTVSTIPNHSKDKEYDRVKQLRCIAQTVYGESRGQSKLAQEAVATVILNRVASPKFPNTACKVVKQYRVRNGKRVYQFSMWHPNDPSLAKTQAAFNTDKGYSAAVLSAIHASMKAMARQPKDKVLPKTILNYHTIHIKTAWSDKMDVYGVIDDHKFFYDM